MLLNLYQVRDNKAEQMLGPIWATQNPVPVIRELVDTLTGREPNLLIKNPEDFSLLHLGEQESTTGVVTGFAEPVVVTTILKMVNELNARATNNAQSSEPTELQG